MYNSGSLKIRILNLILLGFIVILMFPEKVSAQATDRREARLQQMAERRLGDANKLFKHWRYLGNVGIDSIKVQRHNHLVKIYLNPATTHLPVRYPWILHNENLLREMLGRRFRNYDMEFIAREKSLFEFIPNYYRDGFLPVDSSRIRKWPEVASLVTRKSQPEFSGGLTGNHIALWHSHGYYFNAALNRWQWQRARLFGTVEDIFPMEYIVSYISPMLENAGASVLLPRERDFRTQEIIVDNDRSTGNSKLIINEGTTTWQTVTDGFAMKDTLFDGENPFRLGSHLSVSAGSGGSLQYVPEFPEDGEYAVYVSWAKNADNAEDVIYQVNYAGGNAGFSVNQKRGYGTWIYLGHFFFREGMDPDAGSVELLTGSTTEGIITADAVRFGGGMGNVARRAPDEILPNRLSATDRGTPTDETADKSQSQPVNGWNISKRPRFMEGARYYLQYAGMPDSLVYAPNLGRNDYNDDFMSRGEWVNFLMGNPLGPEKQRENNGLGIPIDLVLAFHTDAGITGGDSVIGTLAIYSAQRDDGIFPDGISRLASRDLTDIIQDQIVSDISALFKPDWTRRAIWDRQYSEAWRPNTPAMLLELLSHQNLADMSYGLDPRFQFSVSRAIYKGILRFINYQHGKEIVVQPLPPSHFAIERVDGKTITLSWQATEDELEPSAMPEFYKVYLRKEGEGFNQGNIVRGNSLKLELPEYSRIYSFRVTALNEGGESFPSETLSAAVMPDSEKAVLVVNGFDRISGPGFFDSGDVAGITWWDDLPVPLYQSFSYTGMQYDYDRNSPWLDDDSPGWGASYADHEGQALVGNSFDYPYIHGKAIRNAGYSFVSVSRKAFENPDFDVSGYPVLNLIMGKQKGIPSLLYNDSIQFRVLTPAFIEKITTFVAGGESILLSGAYIATDMVMQEDEEAMEFAKNILGFSWRTNHADNTGRVLVTDAAQEVFLPEILYNNGYHPYIYTVEAPDALVPEGKNSRAVYLYASNQTAAAVLHNGNHKVLSLGFPFESITDPHVRDQFMKEILQFFESQ
jgi:hypothetical protein